MALRGMTPWLHCRTCTVLLVTGILTGNHRWRALLLVLGCVLVAIVISGALVWPITDLIAAHDVGPTFIGAQRAVQLQTAREAVRTQLLTLGAGVFAAGALVFTARNFTLTRQSVRLSEQQQVSDRFGKAIELIGSGTLDVRIGGIYALERVAGDSARDQPVVMEVLCAFVRERSRLASPSGVGDESSHVPPKSGADVQAAVTVIGRRDTDLDFRFRVNLVQANLSGVHLVGLNLVWAALAGVNFTDADLVRLNLREAWLEGADLSRANLADANLANADLSRASLIHASLEGAVLTGASFGRADLTGARLARADFKGANLARAKLTDANLYEADLTNAELSGASLAGANLTRVKFTGANLYETDLTNTEINGTDLKGANLEKARWPVDAEPPESWHVEGVSGLLTRNAPG